MSACTDCGKSCQRDIWKLWHMGEYNCEEDSCNAKLCSTCIDMHPLMHESNHSEPEIHRYCKSCFQKNSVLDFDRTYDVIEGEHSGVTFVFLHGGCGSRAMFSAHAQELRSKFGHQSVLLDLPGHGSLVDVPLSLESCKETLRNVMHEAGISNGSNGSKTVFVGGSLGAYIGFHLLDEFKDTFAGAVLIDCGQNVGPGASLKARIGLVFLSVLGSMCSNATLLKLMSDTSKKSPANYKLIETCYGAGMFFDQVQAQVECLKAVAPANYIPRLSFPILFMNGSEDHRDSEDKWLSLCQDQERSELKVFEAGDHFFTHDERFVEDIELRLDAFARMATSDM